MIILTAFKITFLKNTTFIYFQYVKHIFDF